MLLLLLPLQLGKRRVFGLRVLGGGRIKVAGRPYNTGLIGGHCYCGGHGGRCGGRRPTSCARRRPAPNAGPRVLAERGRLLLRVSCGVHVRVGVVLLPDRAHLHVRLLLVGGRRRRPLVMVRVELVVVVRVGVVRVILLLVSVNSRLAMLLGLLLEAGRMLLALVLVLVLLLMLLLIIGLTLVLVSLVQLVLLLLLLVLLARVLVESAG